MLEMKFVLVDPTRKRVAVSRGQDTDSNSLLGMKLSSILYQQSSHEKDCPLGFFYAVWFSLFPVALLNIY